MKSRYSENISTKDFETLRDELIHAMITLCEKKYSQAGKERSLPVHAMSEMLRSARSSIDAFILLEKMLNK